MEEVLTDRPPCSMRVDGRPLADLLPSWRRAHQTATDADGVRHDTLTLTDPASGLECRLEFVRRPDSPSVEWVTVLTQRGSQRSPLLEHLRSLDITLPCPIKTAAHLVSSLGVGGRINDFAMERREIMFWSPVAYDAWGSCGRLPFMTLDLGDHGITAALGWVGRWSSRASRAKDDGRASFEMGLTTAHLRLEPGEEIRLPRVLLLFWQQDWHRGGNLLRRYLVAHKLPRGADGQVVEPPISCTTWGGMKTRNHLALIKAIQEHDLKFDVYWMDAGWYGPDHETEQFQNFYTEDWAYHLGIWRVNRCVHPDGLTPIADAANQVGMKLLLWFSPYNARRDSELVRNHPEWVVTPYGDKGIGLNSTPANMCKIDLGRDEVRDHLVNQISSLIDEHHVQWFRDDSGMPLPAPESEPPDRQGMGEIRTVHNFYAFWDELRRRHPGLMIDNCGGGTRICLETVSRGLVLHRSDYNCHPDADPIGMQVGTYGLSHFVPLVGGGAPARPGDTYNFRSAWCGGLPFSLFHVCGFGEAPIAPAADYPIDWHRQMIEDYRKVRKYYIGDFHPLSGDSTSDRDWFAYQMHRYDLDEGVVVALRRPRSDFTTADFRLSGLDPTARYEVRDLDGGPSEQADGATLMNAGLRVTINSRPDSIVRIYRRL
jgi:alpha-galactosidase